MLTNRTWRNLIGADTGIIGRPLLLNGDEMGIRTALGASRADVVRLVVGGGSLPVFVGILAGIAGAVGLTRFIRAMLFATEPIDVSTLAIVSALFATVALIACVIPAWRAARVDPMAALRQD